MKLNCCVKPEAESKRQTKLHFGVLQKLLCQFVKELQTGSKVSTQNLVDFCLLKLEIKPA